ncbi:MAG TPA: type II toxin-antitoxin system RelE/ParE family toxin [Longimicrobium sp.]
MYYNNEGRTTLVEFVYLALFERTRKGVLTDAEMKEVEDALLANPRAGVVMVNTGGVRKVRAAQEFRGKSGSARVAYLYVEEQATVYFILAFPKNVQDNLTDEQKKQVRAVVAQIRDEDWPRTRISSGARKH